MKRHSYPPAGLALSLCCLALLVIGWRAASAQSTRGHLVTRNRITVDAAAHWRNWQLPIHAVDVSLDGEVRPHFFRERFNLLDDRDIFSRTLPELRRKKRETAILNIDSTETLNVKGEIILDRKKNPLYTYFLRRGISRVGSNPGAAANILDGDPTTYWEPDLNDPFDDWWIELDLGLVVPVDSLALHFVEAGLGDPFLQFRVLAAPDQEAVQEKANKITFETVGGTRAPNRDQRTFGFSLDQEFSDPNWTGKMVQTIRIIVTETRGGRGALIDEAAWQDLPVADRGDIVYFIRDLRGVEEPVPREDFESLPPERQGRTDYYLRERPRLADVEVWGFGDNVSPGIVQGGGSLLLTGTGFVPGPAFDGDFNTTFLHLVFSPTINRGIVTVDMGATFWLDAMRVSSALPRLLIDGYIIRSSDGSRDTSGQLKWRRLSPREREDNSVERYQHLLDSFSSPPRLRFLEMSIVSANPKRRGGYNTGPNITEYQLFTTAYPAEVRMTSELIELSTARNLGRITWEGDTPPNTTLEVRTRTGDLLGKVIRHFDKSGTEITPAAWKSLLGSYRGPVDTSYVPTSGWSPWSRAYQEPGDRVTSPGQRKFAQIQVEMTTSDRLAAASIRAIEIELLDPVAERIFAELWPPTVTAAGRIDTFDVFVQPNFISAPFSSRSLGFDEILLTMPTSQNPELLEVGLDAGDDQPEQVFRPSGDADIFVDSDGTQLQILRSGSDSVWVRLPVALNVLADADRVYNRITLEGEQVPVTSGGLPLLSAAYGTLPEGERGNIRYFRLTTDAQGQETLSAVDQATYRGLEEEQQGPIRYFRILRGDGAQFPFDVAGDSLDAAAYAFLKLDQRGSVVGPGRLVRLRFRAPVFLNGTTVLLAVRNAEGGGNPDAPWQAVEAGDATSRIGSNTLSINVPISSKTIDEFGIFPNPFTPNADGFNDATEIRFTVFRITSSREVRVRIYTLAGRPVWESSRMIESGQVGVRWTGEDESGNRVPPGLYICQVDLDVDVEGDSATRSRVVAVVY